MRRGRLIKAGMILSVMSMVLVFMTGLCVAGSVLEDSPLGKALDKLDRRSGKVAGLLRPGGSAQGSVEAEAAGKASAEAPAPKLEAAPPISDVPGTSPLPEALDPSQVPGLEALSGALDPSNLPGPDALSGALDPSNLPGSGSLPGMDGLEGLPELSGMDPKEVLQILEKPDELFVVLTVDDLIRATLGLGKNLGKAPLLEAQMILFGALSAEGKVGVKKLDDDAFLVPLELYLKYRIGDEAWRALLVLVAPLEIGFPSAGMVPDGAQAVADNIYKYMLKPILSPLPIYREIKPAEDEGKTAPRPPAQEEMPRPPAQEETPPGATVLGEQATPGGSGDHLPFTGAKLKILIAVLVALTVLIPLLRMLEKTVGKRMG